MSQVVAEADRLGPVLVEARRAGDAAREARGLERVREPRAVMVADGRDEHLCLVLEATERLRVHDPVAVALERRAQAALRLGVCAAPRLVRADRERRQPRVLQLA